MASYKIEKGKEKEFYKKVYKLVFKGLAAYSPDKRAKMLSIFSDPAADVAATVQEKFGHLIDDGIDTTTKMANHILDVLKK